MFVTHVMSKCITIEVPEYSDNCICTCMYMYTHAITYIHVHVSPVLVNPGQILRLGGTHVITIQLLS